MKDYFVLLVSAFCITLVTTNQPQPVIIPQMPYVIQDSLIQDVRFKTATIDSLLNVRMVETRKRKV